MKGKTLPVQILSIFFITAFIVVLIYPYVACNLCYIFIGLALNAFLFAFILIVIELVRLYCIVLHCFV